MREMYAKALKNAEANPENYDDMFAGYENDLNKAVALIEWQKQEIESLTIRMNAFALAAKRLEEERGKYFLLKENGEVVPLVKQGEWITDEEGYVTCSVCGEEHAWDEFRPPYCDMCGAKMKGGEE